MRPSSSRTGALLCAPPPPQTAFGETSHRASAAFQRLAARRGTRICRPVTGALEPLHSGSVMEESSLQLAESRGMRGESFIKTSPHHLGPLVLTATSTRRNSVQIRVDLRFMGSCIYNPHKKRKSSKRQGGIPYPYHWQEYLGIMDKNPGTFPTCSPWHSMLLLHTPATRGARWTDSIWHSAESALNIFNSNWFTLDILIFKISEN